ncbi:MAG: type 1 glutamine amidotransferase [Arenibacterium sp.]
MKLAVLDLSYWPPEFMSGQPRFGEVLRDWVARGVPEADISVVDVIEGAPVPSVDAFDGFVISGSAEGVYDKTSWMQPLRDFLMAARAAGKPLFGVCFGHQIMADVFGGRAEKVGDPVVGVQHFEINGRVQPGHVWHQDQVTEVPPGAEVIASADYCPVAALSYDFPAMSVQWHPEYHADYMIHFLRQSRGQVLSEEKSDAALAELAAGDVSPELFAQEAGAFFRRYLA